jgi:hypothetical protein
MTGKQNTPDTRRLATGSIAADGMRAAVAHQETRQQARLSWRWPNAREFHEAERWLLLDICGKD